MNPVGVIERFKFGGSKATNWWDKLRVAWKFVLCRMVVFWIGAVNVKAWFCCGRGGGVEGGGKGLNSGMVSGEVLLLIALHLMTMSLQLGPRDFGFIGIASSMV